MKITTVNPYVLERICATAGLSFWQSWELKRKNEGKWTEATRGLAVALATLFIYVILWFFWDPMRSGVAMLSFGAFMPIMLWGAWKLSTQELALMWQWRMINARVEEFHDKFVFSRRISRTAAEYVTYTRAILLDWAMIVLICESVEKDMKTLVAVLGEASVQRMKNVTETSRQKFKQDFDLAKLCLGSSLDEGRGYEFFFERARKSLDSKN